MLEWILGWIEGFKTAARLVPQYMQEGWSPEVWAAVIGSGGAVLSGIVGVIGAIIGTKIGAKANQEATLAAAGQLAEVDRKRFISERTWEERRRAYSIILTNLYEAGDYWSYLDDSFSEAGCDAEGFYRTKTYNDWRRQAFEHWWEAKKVFRENRLILSAGFTERFAALRVVVARNDDEHDPPNEPAKMKNAFRTAFADMLKISQGEILSDLAEAP